MEIGHDLVRSLSPVLCCCDERVIFFFMVLSARLIIFTFYRHGVSPRAPYSLYLLLLDLDLGQFCACKYEATKHVESMRMQVVGYYQACEKLDDTALAPVGETGAGKVEAAFEDAVAFMVRFCVFVVVIRRCYAICADAF